MAKMMRSTLSIVTLSLLFPILGHAYPEFIGYKYSSCVTCHFNSQGNGALNDYGRALWSAEIAGRLGAGKKTSEQLGESSGFFGKTQLPWWFRPGAKARQLFFERNPGKQDANWQAVLMQADISSAFILDKNYKNLIMISFGYAPTPAAMKNSTVGDDIDNWVSREHYYRYQATEKLFLFFGMMDKTYGLRIVDHTAYSRSRLGFAQNDQTHGIMAHWISENYEVTLHPFIGNLFQDADLRQAGASMMFEYELKEAWRIGLSALASSNKFVQQNRFGIHSKVGLGVGSSILLDTGFLKNTPEGIDTKMGYYLYSQVMQKISRGYHLYAMGESFKSQMISSQNLEVRTGFGILAFPLARVELRIEAKNTRTFTNNRTVPPDSWMLNSQIHLSL